MIGPKLGQVFEVKWSNQLHSELVFFILQQAQLGIASDMSTPDLVQKEYTRRRIDSEHIANRLGNLLARFGTHTLKPSLDSNVINSMIQLQDTAEKQKPTAAIHCNTCDGTGKIKTTLGLANAVEEVQCPRCGGSGSRPVYTPNTRGLSADIILDEFAFTDGVDRDGAVPGPL